MKFLIKELVDEGVLKTPAIIDAFNKIDRKDFVPEDLKDKAYLNAPLPIGYGQTISQPLTVAFMLELLQPEKGDKILEIGSGSGWQTALLAHIVHDVRPATLNDSQRGRSDIYGKVLAVELVPELMEFGRKNVAKYNFYKRKIAEFHCFNAVKGMPENAPFDRIISAAAGEEIPSAWKEQLKTGGRLVAPVKGSIILLTRKSETEFKAEEYPGFAFVPLVYG
ncbi:MAG: protein-L-isoaspartate O-methyltransferase [Candidatus Pacebacteria bacterium]|nr:protein-L-isoaspartate O-methyltransferase [Candidatus Paceibacterota bacterium]